MIVADNDIPFPSYIAFVKEHPAKPRSSLNIRLQWYPGSGEIPGLLSSFSRSPGRESHPRSFRAISQAYPGLLPTAPGASRLNSLDCQLCALLAFLVFMEFHVGPGVKRSRGLLAANDRP